MKVVTFSDARASLKDTLDSVVHDHAPVIVSRRDADDVVIVSLSDWNAMEETLHLLSSPRNAERLRRSIAELGAGEGVEREPAE